MLDEIKRHCETLFFTGTLGDSHPEYDILDKQANFGIAALCDAMELMIIPADKIHEIIVELEALQRYHAVIRNLIDSLQRYESEPVLA